jgi:amicyanin
MKNEQQETKRARRASKWTMRSGGLLSGGMLLLAACGGGGGGANADSHHGMASMAMPPAANGNAAGPAVATTAVKITNFAFSPTTAQVKVGATVVWTNDDSVQHDVTFDNGGISSNVLDHDDTFSHTFTKPGTYHYICSIHPFMHGTVIVTA